jgi:hypothetical protein
MNLLTTPSQPTDWHQVCSCVWCGNIYQVFLADVSFRQKRQYTDFDDSSVVSEHYYVRCGCGKEIWLDQRDMTPAIKEAVKTGSASSMQRKVLITPEVPTHLDAEPTLLTKLLTRITDWF